VLAGERTAQEGLARYARHSAGKRATFATMFAAQQAIRHLHGRPLDALVRLYGRRRVSLWTFSRYLEIAPPEFALPAPPATPARAAAAA
jgi:hypothetical protein